jgi:DNA-binding MarR family transcriptional regulator
MRTSKHNRTGKKTAAKIDLGRFAPEETMGFLIWDTIRTFHRSFQKLVSSHGINFGLWPFLRALWTQDGVGVRELAQRVHMSAPTTLKAVVTLENAGLAYRTSDKNDARKTLVYLTAKGRELFSRVVPHMEYVNRIAVKGMSKFEQSEVKRLLKHMRSNMAKQQEMAYGQSKSRLAADGGKFVRPSANGPAIASHVGSLRKAKRASRVKQIRTSAASRP